MKTLLIIVFLHGLLLISVCLEAQTGERFPLIRERITNVRLNEIGKRMQLERSRVEQLRPVYLDFEKEKAMIRNQLIRPNLGSEGISEEEAEARYFNQIHNARKLLDLREKYFHEFRKILTAREILEFHRIEMEVNQRIINEARRRELRPLPGSTPPE